eukprot:m.8610 g.8610  ORF g.8610 m.8610 type:complete len:960 (-) comp5378_c0_seq1:376-3255(-)
MSGRGRGHGRGRGGPKTLVKTRPQIMGPKPMTMSLRVDKPTTPSWGKQEPVESKPAPEPEPVPTEVSVEQANPWSRGTVASTSSGVVKPKTTQSSTSWGDAASSAGGNWWQQKDGSSQSTSQLQSQQGAASGSDSDGETPGSASQQPSADRIEGPLAIMLKSQPWIPYEMEAAYSVVPIIQRFPELRDAAAKRQASLDAQMLPAPAVLVDERAPAVASKTANASRRGPSGSKSLYASKTSGRDAQHAPRVAVKNVASAVTAAAASRTAERPVVDRKPGPPKVVVNLPQNTVQTAQMETRERLPGPRTEVSTKLFKASRTDQTKIKTASRTPASKGASVAVSSTTTPSTSAANSGWSTQKPHQQVTPKDKAQPYGIFSALGGPHHSPSKPGRSPSLATETQGIVILQDDGSHVLGPEESGEFVEFKSRGESRAKRQQRKEAERVAREEEEQRARQARDEEISRRWREQELEKERERLNQVQLREQRRHQTAEGVVSMARDEFGQSTSFSRIVSMPSVTKPAQIKSEPDSGNAFPSPSTDTLSDTTHTLPSAKDALLDVASQLGEASQDESASFVPDNAMWGATSNESSWDTGATSSTWFQASTSADAFSQEPITSTSDVQPTSTQSTAATPTASVEAQQAAQSVSDPATSSVPVSATATTVTGTAGSSNGNGSASMSQAEEGKTTHKFSAEAKEFVSVLSESDMLPSIPQVSTVSVSGNQPYFATTGMGYVSGYGAPGTGGMMQAPMGQTPMAQPPMAQPPMGQAPMGPRPTMHMAQPMWSSPTRPMQYSPAPSMGFANAQPNVYTNIRPNGFGGFATGSSSRMMPLGVQGTSPYQPMMHTTLSPQQRQYGAYASPGFHADQYQPGFPRDMSGPGLDMGDPSHRAPTMMHQQPGPLLPQAYGNSLDFRSGPPQDMHQGIAGHGRGRGRGYRGMRGRGGRGGRGGIGSVPPGMLSPATTAN